MEFYKETEFRETEIGRIPKDWDVEEVGNIGQVITGTTPKTKVKEYWNGAYPFVTPTDISETKYVCKTERTVSEKGAKVGRLVPKDAVLVTCIASIGKMALAFEECITNQQINSIVCNDQIDPHYVYYIIKHREDALKNSAGKTTNAIVKKSLFEKFLVPFPCGYDEQRRISAILSSVDSLIQQADSIIRKTQELKKGLMQELLTKGIGHNEFTYSQELGCEIPKGWECVSLGSLCEQRKESIIPKGEGGPFIGLEHIEPEQVRIKQHSKDYELRSLKSKFYPEDILYGKLRPYLDKAVLANIEGICSTDILVLVSTKGKLDPGYLVYLLHSKNFISHAVSSTTGTNHPRTSWGAISQFVFGKPPVSEQKNIGAILFHLDDQINIEMENKARLAEMKKGLMQILLTGKVRIKVS